MIGYVKNVLVGVTTEFRQEEASFALAYGLSLAQRADAHATVQASSVRLSLPFGWTNWLVTGLVQAENRRLGALVEAIGRNARADSAAAGIICSTETPQLPFPDLLASFTSQARVHDLTILDAEPDSIALDRALVETLLLKSGRPLIIVPTGHDVCRSRRIIIAWDGSAKAARATGDALPFLKDAEAVEIVSVTGEKDLPDTMMGADLARGLARHAIEVSVNGLNAADGDVAATLRSHAARFGADLLVMGGFVHSRLREAVFGGVTRSLLKDCPVPLFVSH